MNWYTVFVDTTYGEYTVRQYASTPRAAIYNAVDVLQRRHGKLRGFDIRKTRAVIESEATAES